MTWAELIATYQSPNKIPSDLVYEYITSEPVRQLFAEQRDKLGDNYLASMGESEVFLEARRRARQDLFFLARYFCWETNPESSGKEFSENKICEHVHRRVCDVFVTKDNSRGIPEQDTVSKERVVLYPRGSMKSTIDVIDAVQWILNFPEVRILFLTAADDLAVGFCDETKGHFVEHDDRPSLMNLFFPEYCMTEKELGKESEFQFTCLPWRKTSIRRREATVMASSIESTLSGYHYDVIKADDVISNRNSDNEEQCRKVTKNMHLNVRKMLRPTGYFDAIGTRYADEDYYGSIIENNVGELKRDSGPCWDSTINMTTGLKILVGRAWEMTPDARKQLEDGALKNEDLKVEHYNLLFPEVLSYQFLRQEQRRDEFSFEGQYNQNPRPASITPFPKVLLLKNTVSFNEMPYRGPTSQTWDFAFSQRKSRDYSTGSCAIWNEKGQCYVTDLIRGRFHHTDLAKAVVDFAQKWRPFVIGIEDAGGSRLLEPTIIAEAHKTGRPEVIAVCSRIDWVTPDNQKDAKKMRMASLHPWLTNDRMKFAAHLPYLDALYNEFERCLTSHRHDDIPDVISRQVKYAPAMQQLMTGSAFQSISKVDDAWHILFDEEYATPFSGFLLSHDPETGQLHWVTAPIQRPILDPNPGELGIPPESSFNGLDPILGSGLTG